MKTICWLSLVITCGLYVCGPLVDPDMWWHIVIGRWIVSFQSLPQVDMWTMNGAGQPWQAYSWTVEMVLALVDRFGGIHGLLALQLLSSALLALVLSYVLSRLAGNFSLGAFLGMYACISMANHFTLRPQLFAWILYAVLLFYLESARVNKSSLVSIAPIALVLLCWANVHLSTVVGIVTVAVWLCPSTKGDLSKGTVMLFGTLMALLASFVTPYLGSDGLSLFGKLAHPFLFREIAEFQSAPFLHYSTVSFFLLIALGAVFVKHWFRYLGLARVIGGLGLAVGGLLVIKMLPFALIYWAALICVLWRGAAEDKIDLGPVADGLRRLFAAIERVPKEGLSFLFICIAVVSVYRVWAKPVNLEVVPERAVDFILEHNLPQPILNTFGEGGYLMYRQAFENGVLKHRVSIDSRTGVISPYFWEQYRSARKGDESWDGLVKTIGARTILWQKNSKLSSRLEESGQWCKVYESPHPKVGKSVVFLRKDLFTERKDDKLRSANCS